jgi:hypothetical protein
MFEKRYYPVFKSDYLIESQHLKSSNMHISLYLRNIKNKNKKKLLFINCL